MARSLIATPPPAATTQDARLPALTPHHASSNTAVMGALPSSRSRRVDSLSSPHRLTATTGTTWRGTHTIRSRGVPEVPIPRGRARCLGAWAPRERWRSHGNLHSFPDQGGLERGERPGMPPHPDDPLGRDAVPSSPTLPGHAG
jgi:hypothetical protein